MHGNTRLLIRDLREPGSPAYPVKLVWAVETSYVGITDTLPVIKSNLIFIFPVPAQIIDELSSDDITVQEGDTVVLVCNVTGVPRPEVTWFRRPANSKSTEKESKMCKPRAIGPGKICCFSSVPISLNTFLYDYTHYCFLSFIFCFVYGNATAIPPATYAHHQWMVLSRGWIVDGVLLFQSLETFRITLISMPICIIYFPWKSP